MRRAGRIPDALMVLMWQMIAAMQTAQKDYLQSVHIDENADGTAHRPSQEQPPYRYELDVHCKCAIDAKVYVIDDKTRSTMLLASEY